MYAIATVTTSEVFLPCIIRTSQLLKYLKVNCPYIVLIPNDNLIIKKAMIDNQIQYKEIQVDKFNTTGNRYLDTVNKFKVLQLIEYDKVLFLDADMIVTSEKIIDLFNYLDNEDFCLTKEYFNNRNHICGQFWLCKPNLATYDKIMAMVKFEEDKIDPEYLDDEVILAKVPNYFNIKYFPLDFINDRLLHFSGVIKGWGVNFNLFPSFKFWFYNNEKILTLKNYAEYIPMYEKGLIQNYEL